MPPALISPVHHSANGKDKRTITVSREDHYKESASSSMQVVINDNKEKEKKKEKENEKRKKKRISANIFDYIGEEHEQSLTITKGRSAAYEKDKMKYLHEAEIEIPRHKQTTHDNRVGVGATAQQQSFGTLGGSGRLEEAVVDRRYRRRTQNPSALNYL